MARKPTPARPLASGTEALSEAKSWDGWIIAALAAATLLAYSQSYTLQFLNFDDDRYLVRNLHVTNGLTWEGIHWAFTTGHQSNWHPLTWLSHMLDASLFGMNPAAHHLMNVFLHAVNAILVFVVLRQYTGAAGKSAAVAALFALHPLHVESVAWASERKDVLSTAFWLLTLLAYSAYLRRPNWTRYAGMVLLFALGLMAKPMLVTLPFVLLLLDWWPLRRVPAGCLRNAAGRCALKNIVNEKLPLMALATASCVITYLVQQRSGAMRTFEVMPLTLRLANAASAYLVYLLKTAWPVGLVAYYPHPGVLPWWQGVGAALTLVGITVAAIALRRSRPWAAVGWLWYIGTLVPVIGLIQVGGQACADRYTYIPLLGVFLVVVWGLEELVTRWRFAPFILHAAMATWLTILGSLTWMQVLHWRTSESLFRHALACNTDNPVAHQNLGKALAEVGRNEEAAQHFREVIRLEPDWLEGYYNLGTVALSQQQFQEATRLFETVLKMRPNHVPAIVYLGNTFMEMGQFEKAVEYFTRALSLEPGDRIARYDLAVALLREGKLPEAEAHIQELLRIDPQYPDARHVLEMIQNEMRRSSNSAQP
ncbi:MAG: tetratricopeptide repeat protein [Candidatus Hydrogenedentes bacterium]|nr:tetratricopeptide repeat protein [Candidatus Hydrogenedentota bacterium]